MLFISKPFQIIYLTLSLLISININAANLSHGKMGSLEVSRWTTPHGTQVLFAPANEISMVDIRLVFDAGAARDEMEYAGVAKLSNSLLFEGSKDIDADSLAKTFEGLGVQYSSSSHRDMSVLSFRSLSNKKIISKAVTTIKQLLTEPMFSQESLEREKNKLKVALQLAQENPSKIASLAFFESLYQQTSNPPHPYAIPVNGTVTSLDKIKPEHLKTFFKQYYTNKNAILAIVGDLSQQQAEKIANEISAILPEGSHAPALPAVSDLKEKKSINIQHKSEQTAILIGHSLIKRGDDDYYALYLGNHILGGSGFNSRLVKDLRVKNGLTYGVYSSLNQMRERGPFLISLTTKNQSRQQAIELIQQNLNEFLQKGPTIEEIKQAQLNISGNFPLRTSSNRKICENLATIGFYNLPLDYLDSFQKRIQKLSADDVLKVWQKRIKLEKMVTITVGGE